MKEISPNEQPRFYFALPRLIASQLGWNADRSEKNWLEANLVGGLELLVSFVFAMHLLLAGLTSWLQIALLLPLALLVWICWLLALYFDSLLIAVLRRLGFFATLPNARVQSVILGTATTALACELVTRGSLLSSVGIIWIVAVALNLLAAAVFVVRDALDPAA